ncbi:trigger factor ['Camptotheca acuminata' phytoplasma]|uniref:trigger factor n=1 Tax='Camptotheca acuminata' phytoplasma TaxID=3239192 RepID=UPI00351A3C20
MENKKINNENELVQYNFRIDRNTFELFVNRAFDEVKNTVEIKGFRKGFITRNIFEKHFDSKSLYQDAFDFLVQEKAEEIIKNKDSNVIGIPKVVNFKAEDVINKKEFFDFSLEFITKPTIELCNYKEIAIDVPSAEVTEEEIEEQLDVLLNKNPILEQKTENGNILELGDFALIDFKGYLGDDLLDGGTADNYTLEIGSKTFIDGFETGMIGMETNTNRDVEVVFPEDYFNKEIASKKVVFKIFLKDIQTKKKIDWNDDLVKDLKFPGIDNLHDFKHQIKHELEIQKKDKLRKKKEEFVLDFVFKNSNVSFIPESLIDDEKVNVKKELEEELESKRISHERYLKDNNCNEEQFEARIKEQASMDVKLKLLLDEISLNEKIEVSSEEVETYYKKLKKESKIDVEKMKKNYFWVRDVKQNLIRQNAIEFLFQTNIN